MKSFRPVFLACFLWLITICAFGTHIRAGEIRTERLSCSSFTYRITLIIYTNTSSPSHPGGFAGGGTLSWGEGSMQVPNLNDVTIINAALKIGRVTFVRDVTFSREGTFKISYEEAHRNVSTLNIPNTNDDINFYVDNQLIVSATFCDSSPSFLVPPVDQGCKAMAFYHNPGASDKDGDSLSFSLTIPKGNSGVVISGYADPNVVKFYPGQNYQQANMLQDGPPTFSIEATSGLLTWDAPGAVGTYNIAIMVTQWKKNPADSTWLQFGYVIRDMQIEVSDCGNHPPDIAAVPDVCVLVGELVSINIRGKDQDFDKVTLEVFSDITSFVSSPAIITYGGEIQSTLPDTAHIKISWQPDCLTVREQPYQVVVKITDSPHNGGVRLTRFISFNIKVMGPAPVFTQVQVNPVIKKVSLYWDSYACQNAEAIQVWRRVTERKYIQPHCETGMQKALQYVLIAEIPGSSTSYDDHELAIGAQYCYRIVARFKDVASKISLDTCISPQPAKAPVITHVTVNKTDRINGAIAISWTTPFEIDSTQYPPPYQYAVQRGNSFIGGDWSLLTTSPINETTFLDNLPTVDTAYHYRVLLYVPSVTNLSVDTSSTASSVKLRNQATESNIQLTWDAKVPWSIFLEKYPYHYIYRNETGLEDDFVLIDSVEVNENGLTYSDEGQYKNQPLDDHKVYYYKVETIGGYGNKKIQEPFHNYSQIISDHLLDTTPPCAPVVTVIKPNCPELPCSSTYSNTIQWNASTTSGCRNDIVYYEVYISDTRTGTFIKWKNHVEDSVIIQNDLTDLSGCYKVIAVDWVGNRSAFSEAACGENCPAIKVPNVFTPGVSPEYNDIFTAYSNGDNLNKECSRFIDFLSLKIINRWGEEIFETSSNDIGDVFWEGKDKAGKEMPAGVYYYTAEVWLKYSAEKIKKEQLKGWIQLIR